MRLAVACIVAMGLAGCGADEAARSVEDTVDPVARAAEKTAASGGARLNGEMVIKVETLKIPMTIDGAISFDDERMRMKLDVGQVKGLGPAEVEDLRKE